MNPMAVQLVGVFDPDGEIEGFVYSINAPTNLYVRNPCEDGSRMGPQVMAAGLNRLIEQDLFGFNEYTDIEMDGGAILRFQVGERIAKEEAGAHQCMSGFVRLVSVGVLPGSMN